MTERHSSTIVWIALVVGILAAAFVAIRAQNRNRPATLTAMDYVEIEQLNAAYGHYIDTGADQGQAWARLFITTST
jgi:hypothetical protein